MSESVFIPALFKTESIFTSPQPTHILRLSTYVNHIKNKSFNGLSKIIGTLKINGVFGSRRVSLFERVSLTFIESVWSDETTGKFEFLNIDGSRKYMVIADDDQQVYNAVIADWVLVND